MSPWRREPFFRICIPFALGIFYSERWPSGHSLLLLSVFLLLLGLSLIIRRRFIYFRLYLLNGILAGVVLFLTGSFVHGLDKAGLDQLEPDKDCFYIGLVKDVLHHHSWGDVDLIQWQYFDENEIKDSKTVHYRSFYSSTTITGKENLPKPGDHIVAKVKWQLPEKARFQGDFGEYEYLRAKGLYIKSYLNRHSWKRIRTQDPANKTGYNLLLKKTRSSIQLTLSKYLTDSDSVHVGIMKALLLGDRTMVPKILNNKLAGIGVIHVLAVSGLHVGIVFWILNGLFGLMFHGWIRRRVVPLMLIICIAGYTLLTGASPSVIRASIMISVFILAKLFGIKGRPINIVLFTGSVILIFKPFLLFNLGFQLSFLAVLGIIWIYPLLKSWYRPRSFSLQKLIDLIYVSLSAQLATSPLTIARFQIFPLYFLVSNLIIAPLFILSLYCGILLTVFSLTGIEAAAVVTGKIISVLLTVSLSGVELIYKLPFSTLSGLYVADWQIIVIIAITGSIIAWGRFNSRSSLRISLLCLFLVLIIQIFKVYQISSTSEIIKLKDKRNEVILLRAGRNAIVIEVTDLSESLSRLTDEYCMSHFITSVSCIKPNQSFITANESIKEHLDVAFVNKPVVLNVFNPELTLSIDSNKTSVLYIPSKYLHHIGKAKLKDVQAVLVAPIHTINRKEVIIEQLNSTGFRGKLQFTK